MIAILCLVLPLGSSCGDYRQAVFTPHALLAQPAQKAPRRLRLSGVAQRVQHRTSHTGRPYDIIFLCDSDCIRIYYPERSAIENGDRASAVGTFYSVRNVGTRVYHNEVDADEMLLER